ncbi:MAG: Trk system potassium transporter TrkA [Acidobacteriota bacterium]
MMFKKKKRVESALVLGLGGIGSYLGKRLVHEGYAVTVIENDREPLHQADGSLDARLIKGDAMSVACWEEADAHKMDLLIAVTDNDAVNMVASMIGHRFGIRRKIARVRSLEFGDQKGDFADEGLSADLLIHPEEIAAQEIHRLVARAAGDDVVEVADGQCQVIAITVEASSPIANRTVAEIAQLYSGRPFRLVACARGIRTLTLQGNLTILPQDHLFIMARREDIPHLMHMVGVEQRAVRRVMILGGGLVGRRVAELLGKSMEVTLIERDSVACGELCDGLKHTEVLHGDGSNADVLALAGIIEMDVFIATTGSDETNIVSCLLAKHLMNRQNRDPKGSKGKTIAMVNKEDYVVLASTIGLDVALNKKMLAGSEILRFIRRGELLSVARLHGVEADVVEVVAAEGSKVTRQPLAKLRMSFKGKMIVGGVLRNGHWEIGLGDTRIEPGDRVIMACHPRFLKDVRRLFTA